MERLDGKAALVLGASRGIGREAAAELAGAGAAVVVASRDLTACRSVVSAIEASGGTALASRVDVGNYGEVLAAVELSADRFGGLDIVVNNAGVIEPIGLLHECDPGAWARNIHVNVVGPFHGCRAVLPLFLARGGGTIVNVSSGAASSPREGWSAYCAGKAGLAMLTAALHLEYGSRGIRAIGFRPGIVDTEMQARIRASGVNEVSRLPRSALRSASEPGRAIAWLCTRQAADLAGSEIDIRDPSLRARIGLPPR